MEKSANYFIVGLFITATIFVFFWFLIWLADSQNKENFVFYTVEFTDSISGLEEGSDIQYKGVKVGKVMKMRLTPGNNELVRVDIGVDKATPIRAHTKVMLQTQGITGLVQLEMSTENSDTAPPKRRAGLRYPVLQGQGSQLHKALEDVAIITGQIAEIATKMNDIITRNRAPLERFASEGLSEFTVASKEIKGMAGQVRKLADKLSDDPSQIIYQPAAHGVEIPQ